MPMLLARGKSIIGFIPYEFDTRKFAATASGDPSVDALSTTMISSASGSRWRRTDSRHSSKKAFAFQLTMMIDRRMRMPWPFGEIRQLTVGDNACVGFERTADTLLVLSR